MAWPKPRNRRSPDPTETVGGAPDGVRPHAGPHALTPDRDHDRDQGRGRRSSWPSPERWPSAHATVVPVPAEEYVSAAETADAPDALDGFEAIDSFDTSEAFDAAEAEADSGDRPFWASWGRADEAADLDGPDDGLPED